MTQPTSPTDILGQINSAREQTYQNIATAQGILAQANAAASAAAQDRAAIQAIAQQTVRVDTSIGTRVFAGDTMIFGDTGYRNIPLSQSFAVDGTSPRCTLRRVGDLVEIESRIKPAEALVGASRRGRYALVSIPWGFFPRSQGGSSFASGSVWPLTGAVANEGLGAVAFTANQMDIAMPIPTSGSWADSDVLLVHASWLTRDPWPTSLPGTPA